MKTYGLYLESGPKHRKTMVHVLELLGCVQSGPTTDAAVEATRDAIRGFLTFLADHGDTSANPKAAFDTRVEAHVTEGQFLGNGDSSITYAPDERIPTPKEAAALSERFGWIREAIARMVAPLDAGALAARPASGDRPVGAIVNHVLGAAPNYVRGLLGTQTELNRIARDAEKGVLAPAEALRLEGDGIGARLAEMTPAQRRSHVQRGGTFWNAAKMFRRLLEHEWEHHQELTRRLVKG